MAEAALSEYPEAGAVTIAVPVPLVASSGGGGSGDKASDAAPTPVARNFAALFGGQLVTWMMTLVWTMIVPRVLGPDEFGIVTAMLSVSGVSALFLGLGARQFLVREIVLHRHETGKIVGTAIVLRITLTPIVAVAAYTFAHLAHYNHEQSLALYLATLFNVIVLLNEPILAGFQAIERMKYIAFVDVINKSAQSLLGIGVALVGLGAIGITANMAVVAFVVLGLSVVWFGRHVRIELATGLRVVSNMARQSSGLWLTGVFFTFYLWIDTIMLSLMTTSKVVAWYGASTTLYQTLLFVPNLMATSWMPRFVGAFKRGRLEGMYRTARKPLELVLVISAPLAAGMAIASAIIVRLLYGSAYDGAAPVLAILSLCLPATYTGIMTVHMLIASGRQRIFQYLMLGATLVNPPLNYLLISWAQRTFHNGAIGAALALLVTELLVSVGGVCAVCHVVARPLVRRCALSFGASAAASGVAFVAAPLGAIPGLVGGMATLVILIAWWRIPTEEEISFVRNGLAKVRRRLGREHDRQTPMQDLG
jgi:O-antigen/teichoic acid export membrane protein